MQILENQLLQTLKLLGVSCFACVMHNRQLLKSKWICVHMKNTLIGKWDILSIQDINTGICSKLCPHSENSRKLELQNLHRSQPYAGTLPILTKESIFTVKG